MSIMSFYNIKEKEFDITQKSKMSKHMAPIIVFSKILENMGHAVEDYEFGQYSCYFLEDDDCFEYELGFNHKTDEDGYKQMIFRIVDNKIVVSEVE